LIRFFSL